MNEDLLSKCRACGRQVSRKALECREPNPTLTEQEYGVWWKYCRDNNMFDKPNEKITVVTGSDSLVLLFVIILIPLPIVFWSFSC